MKRLFLLFVLAGLLTGVFFGCSDDETDNPLTPGDPEDPDYTLFVDQFDGMNNTNLDMFGVTFGFIDLIGNPEVSSSTAPKITGDPTYEYHEASGYWYCTWVDTNEYDEIHTYVDSLQFKEGSTAVQWPDMDSVTEIRSYVTLTLTGPTIDTGIAHQNLVITANEAGSDTIIINGSADLLADATFEDIDDADTTVCTMNVDYEITLTNLLYNTEYMNYEGELTCPRSGSVVFNGSFDLACTGADSGAISGTWNVTEAFAEGDVTMTITHGDNVWTVIDECGHPDFPEPLDDTLAIEIFMEEYDGVDRATGSMFSTFLELTGIIINAGNQINLDTMIPEGVDMTYHGTSKYWYCTVESYDEISSHSIFTVDSIQFLQGDSLVKWPDDALLTEVRSGLVMTVEGPEVDSAEGHQVMTITRPELGSDTLIVNGTTAMLAGFTYADSSEYSIVYRSDFIDFSAEVTDLSLNMADAPEEGAPCPFAGTINYTADVSLVATGDENWVIEGTWTVDQTFDNGAVTVDVGNGGSTWTFENTCD